MCQLLISRVFDAFVLKINTFWSECYCVFLRSFGCAWRCCWSRSCIILLPTEIMTVLSHSHVFFKTIGAELQFVGDWTFLQVKHLSSFSSFINPAFLQTQTSTFSTFYISTCRSSSHSLKKLSLSSQSLSLLLESFEFQEVPSCLALHNLSLPSITSESDSEPTSQPTSPIFSIHPTPIPSITYCHGRTIHYAAPRTRFRPKIHPWRP
jgi:hypothetical protein